MSERIPAGGPYKAAAGLHEPLSLEHLMEARRAASIYCGSQDEYCCQFLRHLKKASILVAKARIRDLVENANYTGIDSGILELYNRLVEFYADYISASLLSYGENPVMHLRTSIVLDGVKLEKGEYVEMDPAKAAALYVASIAEPVETTFIKIGTACIGEEEERRK